jgi:carbon-monoxide dehydrogenase medium subunit
MKPAPFSYHAPKTIEEALALLAKVAPDDGRVLAGGQSLVPTMAFRLARPRHLVDINGVAGLDRLAIENGKLCVGARVRHAAFEKPAEPGALGRLLSKVVQHIAHHPIRTRGTMCGSLAHADPASEWCAVAAALDAEMIARSARGARTIAARDYFQGIMTTTLAEDELLAEVRLPLLPADTRTGFAEFNRRAGDFAFAMAVVAYQAKDGKVVDPRIAVGGAEASPRRIAEAEQAIAGKAPGAEAFQQAGEAAAKAVAPLDDASIPQNYRRDLVRALVIRALSEAA